MKIQKFVALLCLVLALVVGCQPARDVGNIVQYSQNLEAIHQLYFGGSGELRVTQGDRDYLTVSGKEPVIDDLRISVDDGVLRIILEDVPSKLIRPVEMTLSVRQLDRIELAGVGKISALALNANVLNVDVSGTGTVAIDDLTAERLVVNGSGSGRIKVKGQVANQQVNLSGAGRYLASELQSQSATIDLSGIGDAILWATKRLAINLSGAGSVQYYGTSNVRREVSGYGSIDYLGQNPV
jgi:hypothetical protein